MSNVKQLPEIERPRERMLMFGIEALSAVELLAILLGSGMRGKSVIALAQELLAHFGSLKEVAQASCEDLCQIKGLGKAKAIQLKAAFCLSGRLQRETFTSKCPLTTPEAAFHWVKGFLAHQKKEVFGVILQDVKGHAFKWEVISIGTLTQTLVHPREVFNPAIRHRAASIIVAHNHPSGDPTASPADIHLTRQLVRASRSVGIPIHDHLIVTESSYISLREKGVIKKVRRKTPLFSRVAKQEG